MAGIVFYLDGVSTMKFYTKIFIPFSRSYLAKVMHNCYSFHFIRYKLYPLYRNIFGKSKIYCFYWKKVEKEIFSFHLDKKANEIHQVFIYIIKKIKNT